MAALTGHIDNFGPDNRTAYDRLVTAVSSKPVVALMGAGLSMRVGYPSWPDFLTLLRERACAAKPAEANRLSSLQHGDDLCVGASQYKQALGSALFGQVVAEVFGSRHPQFDDVHASLVSLPFKHILTTNYDPVFSAAHVAVTKTDCPVVHLEDFDVSMPLLQRLSENLPRQYVHLHGSIAYPEQIVLTLEDYNRVYEQGKQAVHFLNTLFSIYTVVFIGFSMTDADLMGRFRSLGSLLGKGEPRHFAIVPSPGVEKVASRRIELRERFRVEPVFYDPKNKHELLEQLVTSLVADVKEAQKAQLGRDSAHLANVFDSVVSDLLAGQPDKVAEARTRFVAAVNGRGFGLGVHDAGSGDQRPQSIDAEIDAIFRYIDQGLPDAAIAEYKLLFSRSEVTRSGRLQYRLHANIGNALYTKNDLSGAAHEYLAAVSCFSESSNARSLEVLAYYVQGNDEKAHQLAVALCNDDPSHGRAQSLRLRTLSTEASFDVAEGSIPSEAFSDPEVLIALADLASDHGFLRIQENYLRLAIALSPKWLDPLGSLAVALLTAAKSTADIDIELGFLPKDKSRLEEAEVLLTDAMSLVPPTDPMARLAALHLNRSVTRRLLGKKPEARADVSEAFRRKPSELEIVLAEAMERAAENNLNGAISCLEALTACITNVRSDVMLALYLVDRGKPEDLSRGISLITPWLKRLGEIQPVMYRGDVCRLAIRLYATATRLREIRLLVDSIPIDALSTTTLLTVQTRLAMAENKPEDAKGLADKAARTIVQETNWFDRREVAGLALDLQLWPLAFNVLKDIIPSTRLGADTTTLLRAAHLAREDKFVLSYCNELRLSGFHFWPCYELEAQTLANNREPEQAIKLLQEWLALHPADFDARLVLSLIARQTGNHSYAESDPNRLPSIESIRTPARGAALAFVLRHGPQPELGLKCAYQVWRRFPDDYVARHSLVINLLNPNAPPMAIEQPTAVAEGSAIHVQPEDEPARWIVIEPGPNPSLSRGEFAADHPISKAGMGTSVGQAFIYNGRRHRVLAVENCMSFRAHECLATFEELFPDTSPFRKFKVVADPPPDADAKEVLGEVWDELQKQEKRQQRLKNLHQEQHVPLAAVAIRLGRPLFNLMRHFALNSELTVHCAQGVPGEWRAAMNALSPNGKIVLDATAVATLYLLGLIPKLKDWPFRFLIPRSVLDELREIISDAGNMREPRSVLGSSGGKPFLHQFSIEDLAREVKQLESVLEELKSSCQIMGGTALLSFEPATRDALLNFLGPGSADAIATAKEQSAALWTDDLGTAVWGGCAFGVPRVWSHAVCRKLRSMDKLSHDELVDAEAHLLEFGYSVTTLNAQEIVDLLRKADWSVSHVLGRALLKQATAMAITSPGNSLVYALVLIGIWRDCPNEIQAQRLICSILDGIGKKHSGALVARKVYRAPNDNDELEPRKMRRLKRMLRRWRSTSPRAR